MLRMRKPPTKTPSISKTSQVFIGFPACDSLNSLTNPDFQMRGNSCHCCNNCTFNCTAGSQSASRNKICSKQNQTEQNPPIYGFRYFVFLISFDYCHILFYYIFICYISLLHLSILYHLDACYLYLIKPSAHLSGIYNDKPKHKTSKYHQYSRKLPEYEIFPSSKISRIAGISIPRITTNIQNDIV